MHVCSLLKWNHQAARRDAYGEHGRCPAAPWNVLFPTKQASFSFRTHDSLSMHERFRPRFSKKKEKMRKRFRPALFPTKVKLVTCRHPYACARLATSYWLSRFSLSAMCEQRPSIHPSVHHPCTKHARYTCWFWLAAVWSRHLSIDWVLRATASKLLHQFRFLDRFDFCKFIVCL